MSKYTFTEQMDEVSGMGGDYERTCRQMIIAGAEWLDTNSTEILTYSEAESTIEALQDIMSKASGKFGCTGAMMQACLSHVMFIKKNGWDSYVAKMTESKKVEDEDHSELFQSDFETRLQLLLNQTCQENASDTPDYILAKYLISTLEAFNVAVRDRDKHHDGYYNAPVDPDLLEHKCCDHNH